MKSFHLHISTLCTILLANSLFVIVVTAAEPSQKKIIGATEIVYVKEANLHFKARIDTGAKTTSIHAQNIQIDRSMESRGSPISFDIVNKKGQSQPIKTVVQSISTVKTSEGSEKRYEVLLTLQWENHEKQILVNLNNRNKMTYGLLLGRNWLYKDFLVDVEKSIDE